MAYIGTIILSEDVAKDDNGKNIILGVISQIALPIFPNNYSFKLNFTIVDLKLNASYDVTITMTDGNGEQVIYNKIEGLVVNPPQEKKDISFFASLNVLNQQFKSKGLYKVTVSVIEQENPDSKHSLTSFVPVVERR